MMTDFLQFSNFRKRFDGRTGLHENSLKKHPSHETAFFKFFVLLMFAYQLAYDKKLRILFVHLRQNYGSCKKRVIQRPQALTTPVLHVKISYSS